MEGCKRQVESTWPTSPEVIWDQPDPIWLASNCWHMRKSTCDLKKKQRSSKISRERTCSKVRGKYSKIVSIKTKEKEYSKRKIWYKTPLKSQIRLWLMKLTLDLATLRSSMILKRAISCSGKMMALGPPWLLRKLSIMFLFFFRNWKYLSLWAGWIN